MVPKYEHQIMKWIVLYVCGLFITHTEFQKQLPNFSLLIKITIISLLQNAASIFARGLCNQTMHRKTENANEYVNMQPLAK